MEATIDKKLLRFETEFLEAVVGPSLAKIIADRHGHIKFTPTTATAIKEIADYSESGETKKSPHDKAVLQKILSTLKQNDKKWAKDISESALNRFHSLMEILATDEGMLNAFGISVGMAYRIKMLATICLYDGSKKIILRNGRASALYFGQMYKGGLSEKAVGFLDGKYCLTEAAEISDINEIANKAKELKAKYVIGAKRIKSESDIDNTALERAKELKSKLNSVGIKLVDSYIFTPNSTATLALTTFSDELKYTVVENR